MYAGMADGEKCFLLAHACIRERKVRAGEIPPKDETERRWLLEGPRENRFLESLTRQHW